MDFKTEFTWLAIGFVYVVIGMVTVLVSKFIKNWLTPYKLDEQLTQKDNHALGLAITGYFAGVLAIYLGATVGYSPDEIPPFGETAIELGRDVAYAFGGILLLNLSCVIVDKFVLYKFSTQKEIIEDRNVGTGAVEAGCLLAGGLVIAGAIQGEGDLVSAIVFYVLGQVALVLFGLFYQWFVSYDIHDEIEKDNVAAGVSLGMSMVALGIILLKATKGDFISWQYNLTMFGLYAIGGFVSLMIIRKFVDVAFLPGATIHGEIVEDRNMNAAFFEGSLSVGAAISVLLIF